MTTYKIDSRKPRRVHNAVASIYESQYAKVNKLLDVENFEHLTPEEWEELGIERDSVKLILRVEFDDNSSLRWFLRSGYINYYDDVMFTHSDGIEETLDCTYELDDITIETDTDIYIVKLDIVKDSDTKLLDQADWKQDEILWNTLLKHRGHNVQIVSYGDDDNPEDVCLECEDCNEVILDAGIYTICAREDEFM